MPLCILQTIRESKGCEWLEVFVDSLKLVGAIYCEGWSDISRAGIRRALVQKRHRIRVGRRDWFRVVGWCREWRGRLFSASFRDGGDDVRRTAAIPRRRPVRSDPVVDG